MKEYLAKNKEAYDQAANEYYKRKIQYAESEFEILDPFIASVKSRFSNPKVLELGPGSGLVLQLFEEAGFETAAIDISGRMIDVARKTSPNTRFIEGEFLSHDFQGEKFDGIFAKAFIHLFPKQDAILVLRKIRGMLNNRGIAHISTTPYAEPREGYENKEDYPGQPKRYRKNWTENELLESLTKEGFVLVQKYYTFDKTRDKKWVNFNVECANLSLLPGTPALRVTRR